MIDFIKYAAKGNNFLTELAAALGDKNDKARASRILRAVFHTLRDHLTLEENFQFMAQLPMALKGIYVDGWMPSAQKEKHRTKEEFLIEILTEDRAASNDFSSREELIGAVKTVLRMLGKYVSEGELKDMKAVLPEELKEFVDVESGHPNGYEPITIIVEETIIRDEE